MFIAVLLTKHNTVCTANLNCVVSHFGVVVVGLHVEFVGRWCTGVRRNDPCSEVYGGPWPSSELETQAVTSFVLEHRDSLVASMTMHNYGQLIMTRWAYASDLYLPDHNETVRHFSCPQSAVTTPITMRQ